MPLRSETRAARWLSLFILFAACIATAQQPEREDPPAFNSWVARSFLIEVQPLVEKHTGWQLPGFPKFQVVTRAEYCEATIREIECALQKSSGLLAEPVPRAALMREVRPHTEGLLGRYSATTKTIFLLPGNLQPAMRDLNVSARFTRDLVEIVAAHEMTHAFQDEKYPFLEHRRATMDNDAQEAWSMLVEGHAMFVQERVAEDLKVSEAARTMAAQMAAREAVSPTATVMRRYIDGRKFVQAVFEKGGLKMVQRLFEHPPRSPAMIRDPELFFAMDQPARAEP